MSITMKECRRWFKLHGHWISPSIDKTGPNKGKYLIKLRYAGCSGGAFMKLTPYIIKRMVERNMASIKVTVKENEA